MAYNNNRYKNAAVFLLVALISFLGRSDIVVTAQKKDAEQQQRDNNADTTSEAFAAAATIINTEEEEEAPSFAPSGEGTAELVPPPLTTTTLTATATTTTSTTIDAPPQAPTNAPSGEGTAELVPPSTTTDMTTTSSSSSSSSSSSWSVSNMDAVTATATSSNNGNYNNCLQPDLHPFDPNLPGQKRRYKVGVHAIRGVEAAFQEYNKTFGEYLTETAGQRFHPPIEFEVVPVSFRGLFDLVQAKELDFVYSNPGIYSCVGVETGARPVATIVSRLEVRGKQYDLDVFGGVIFTRADNFEINSIRDLKGKVIGAGAMQMILAGQQQFYEMLKEGLSYIMDPKQVVFTYQQYDIVRGVLDGSFDVGFVRTDTIERTTTLEGQPIDPDLFKVISPRVYVMENGDLFPFLHSTDIYPEWLTYALPHTSSLVTAEVQEALFALQEHAEAGEHLVGHPSSSVDAATTSNIASMLLPEDYKPSRCDTTPKIARIALEASLRGKLAGWRPTMSYFEVRTMQQSGGFMTQDERGKWQCTRAATLYDSIICPEGHYKLNPVDYERSCPDMGLSCKEGWDCYCQPCVRANEVEVYECDIEEVESLVEQNLTLRSTDGGCDKMSVCGRVQQTNTITFCATDNRVRDNATISVKMHIEGETQNLPVISTGDHEYKFSWSSNRMGVGIMEIAVNNEQIPSSPMRVEVAERRCDEDFPGELRKASPDGSCICDDNTLEIGGKCVGSTIIAVAVSVFCVTLALVIGLFVLQHKTKKTDQLWHVAMEELHFDDPIEIIGEGSFGQVIKAEYRGTPVAIKRVLSRKEQRGKNSGPDNSNYFDDSDAMLATQECSIRPLDLEAGLKASTVINPGGDPKPKSMGSMGNTMSASEYDLDFLKYGFSFDGRRKSNRWGRSRQVEGINSKIDMLGIGTRGSIGSAASDIFMLTLCPWVDKHARQKRAFIAEMRLLSRLRHPCITTVMGAVMQTNCEPMLVMEFCEYGSLSDLLANESMHAGGEVILQIVRDISQGLRYLHSSKPVVLHGDLKAKNILIDSRFRAKVCDFGLSNKKKESISGSPLWMAPEYLRGKADYDCPQDVYSFGIVLYEIYSRKTPFQGENLKEVLYNICNPRKNKRPDVPASMPPKMVDLMKKCWSPDPVYRPQARELDLNFQDMAVKDAEPITASMRSKQNTSGDMLYQVFPKHIADALKAGEKVEPESHDMVTIFFSDIVGFTTISETLSALKVSHMLDRLYLAFDRLASSYGVFKIETIGDAWMGVTNLGGSQEDHHVKAIAQFAMDAVAAAREILIDDENPSRGHVNIRVGFHSGPVVSNVIGSLNPRYGLFGDTVNVSSRMESNSISGRIHCSEVSANLLLKQAPEIRVSKRGKIHIKGKGDMVTYWVGKKHKAAHEEDPGASTRPSVSFADLSDDKSGPFPPARRGSLDEITAAAAAATAAEVTTSAAAAEVADTEVTPTAEEKAPTLSPSDNNKSDTVGVESYRQRSSRGLDENTASTSSASSESIIHNDQNDQFLSNHSSSNSNDEKQVPMNHDPNVPLAVAAPAQLHTPVDPQIYRC